MRIQTVLAICALTAASANALIEDAYDLFEAEAEDKANAYAAAATTEEDTLQAETTPHCFIDPVFT